jgi:hypothetical protein
MLTTFAKADLRPVLPTITVPTLLLYGTADMRAAPDRQSAAHRHPDLRTRAATRGRPHGQPRGARSVQRRDAAIPPNRAVNTVHPRRLPELTGSGPRSHHTRRLSRRWHSLASPCRGHGARPGTRYCARPGPAPRHGKRGVRRAGADLSCGRRRPGSPVKSATRRARRTCAVKGGMARSAREFSGQGGVVLSELLLECGQRVLLVGGQRHGGILRLDGVGSAADDDHHATRRPDLVGRPGTATSDVADRRTRGAVG